MAVNLIVLGPPGSGKGTQAERLALERGIPKISTGDILREAVHDRTDMGLKAKALMDRGDLVSDEVVVGIVRDRLARNDVDRGFVLDGFPRTVSQARALDDLMQNRDQLIVVEIVVPEAELIQRLVTRRVCQSCGLTAGAADGRDHSRDACQRCGGKLVQRSDDNQSVVQERLKVYAQQTRPLVEYYQARPTFRSVDGAQGIDAVTVALRAAIEAAAHAITSKVARP